MFMLLSLPNFTSYSVHYSSVSINPFWPNVPFLYPVKISENQRFSNIFRGYRNGTVGQNGLITMSKRLIMLFQGLFKSSSNIYDGALLQSYFRKQIDVWQSFAQLFFFVYILIFHRKPNAGGQSLLFSCCDRYYL